jgi:hypothetical protein
MLTKLSTKPFTNLPAKPAIKLLPRPLEKALSRPPARSVAELLQTYCETAGKAAEGSLGKYHIQSIRTQKNCLLLCLITQGVKGKY